MVVLSLEHLLTKRPRAYQKIAPKLDDQSFILQDDPILSPAKTTVKEYLLQRNASGPKDFPDSILSAELCSS
jgi:heterodisulfide reductase subunit A-like polyferredoxin